MRAGGTQGDPAPATRNLGYDVQGVIGNRRQGADVAVEALGDDQDIVSADDIQAIRERIDNGTANSDEMAGFYAGFDSKLQDAIEQSLIGIQYEADDLAGSSQVNASLDGLTAATDALDAVDQQLRQVTPHYLGTSSSRGARHRARRREHEAAARRRQRCRRRSWNPSGTRGPP